MKSFLGKCHCYVLMWWIADCQLGKGEFNGIIFSYKYFLIAQFSKSFAFHSP